MARPTDGNLASTGWFTCSATVALFAVAAIFTLNGTSLRNVVILIVAGLPLVLLAGVALALYRRR